MVAFSASDDLVAALIDQVLIKASDDWVPFFDFDAIIGRHMRQEGLDSGLEARIAVGLTVVKRLLDEKLICLGDVSQDVGFRPWTVSGYEAIERIQREWNATGSKIKPGDICWLANTELGDAMADRILRRTQREG